MFHIGFPFGLIVNGQIIPFHGLFEFLAFYLGIWYYYRLRKGQVDHYSEGERFTIMIGAAIGALIGSRLLGLIDVYGFAIPLNWLIISQTKTVIGGFIGGWIGVEIAKKIMKRKESSGDLFVYPMILALMVGRIGCLITGVSDGTVGNPSNLPWAFDQGDGILRHPTSLYEILVLGGIWLLLIWLKRRVTLKNGDLFKLFMTLYCGWRFFIEFMKPVDPLIFGLTSIQIAALGVVMYYAYIFLKRFNTQ